MDFTSQKGQNELNLTDVINKLLCQQSHEKTKQEDPYFPTVQKHNRNKSLPLNQTNKAIQKLRFNYVKVRRTTYDHTRSLRHYEHGFSVRTVLNSYQEKSTQFSSNLKNKLSYKLRNKFRDILKKTDLIINSKTSENKNKIEPKIEKKKRNFVKKENKSIKKFIVDIPTIRAQTIVPCPRKRNGMSMVDAEITTDSFMPIFY